MLTARHKQRAMTLIELMVAMAIAVILLAVAVPNFKDWIQGTQIRTAAEAIQNGLQLARAEAVGRNTTAQFIRCSNTDSSWDVLVTSAVAFAQSCNMTDSAAATGWERVQIRSGGEGSANAIVAASQPTIQFNGLGRVTPLPATDIGFQVSNPKGGRSLRIVVSPGGQIRMCDPALSSSDPQGC